jgi:hypothetical protein
MKINICFILQTSRKHSPWLLLEIFLQFSVVQFFAATNGESSRQTINFYCLNWMLLLAIQPRADHTENNSSCIVVSWVIAAKTCLQRCCHVASVSVAAETCLSCPCLAMIASSRSTIPTLPLCRNIKSYGNTKLRGILGSDSSYCEACYPIVLRSVWYD